MYVRTLVVSGKVISGEYSINTISMENSNQFIIYIDQSDVETWYMLIIGIIMIHCIPVFM